MRATQITTTALILMASYTARAAELPDAESARRAHEEAFQALRKTSDVIYRDKGSVRLTARTPRDKWRKVSRRIDFSVRRDDILQVRLRRARIQGNEDAVFYVRWTELVPATELSEAERTFYKRIKKRKGKVYHCVSRSILVRRPWDPTQRDLKTNAYENTASCGKTTYEIKGNRLSVSVLSLVDRDGIDPGRRALRRDKDGRIRPRTPNDPTAASPARDPRAGQSGAGQPRAPRGR